MKRIVVALALAVVWAATMAPPAVAGVVRGN